MARAQEQTVISCWFCGGIFTAYRSTARFCSAKCRKSNERHPENAKRAATAAAEAARQATVARSLGLPAARAEKKQARCRFCRKPFEPRRSDAFLCSPKCRKAWNRSPELAIEPVAPRTSTIIALERARWLP